MAPGAENPWLDTVAAVGGTSGEVSLAVAIDDLSGARMLRAPVLAEVD